MAKTLKDFLNERQLGPMVVKNPDEQKFIDKHVIAKVADRNGNDDELFKGSKVKFADRKKDRKGYNPGEDEEVYEELKGNQHKIDANKNGKVDAHDFKLLRGKKKVAEEAEELDEISQMMARAARDKAGEEIAGHRKAIEKEWNKNKPNYGKVSDIQQQLQRRKRLTDKVTRKLAKEEAEQIDELSTPTLQSYRKKARAQGNAIVDKMKMGGGDWSKDQKDTKTLRKRAAGAQASGKQLVKRGESLKTEEAEQIDELDRQLGGTLSRYINKTKDNPKRETGRNLALKKRWGDAKYGTPEPKVKGVDRFKEETELQEAHYEFDVSGEHGNKAADEFVGHAKKAGIKAKVHTYNGPGGGNPVVHLSHSDHKVVHKFIKKLYDPHMSSSDIERHRFHVKEEVEQIDELSKQTLRSYAQNAKDQMSRSDTLAGREMGARNAGAKPSAKEKFHNRRADKRHAGLGLAIDKLAREEVEIEEKLSPKASMGTYIKDFQKSDAPQFKGKSKEKRRVMAIAAKLSAERGGKPLNKEERLLANLGDLAESHKRTLLDVFSKLNEDNQRKFMTACETPEGVEQMLDFAIQNRGE